MCNGLIFRFLEISQFFKQADKDASHQASYDKELISIQDQFYDLVVEFVTKDNSSVVRRTLLTVCIKLSERRMLTLVKDLTRLALFFGRQKTNDQLLPFIITFLNDRDWLLRCAFFHNIVGVSAFVGRSSLELFILPCITQALTGTCYSSTILSSNLTTQTDEEEFVVEKSVSCLACLCELGLFRKHILLEIVHKTAPMLLHPNTWVRYGIIYCFLSTFLPLLRSYGYYGGSL